MGAILAYDALCRNIRRPGSENSLYEDRESVSSPPRNIGILVWLISASVTYLIFHLVTAIYIVLISYRDTHKGWDWRDECTEFHHFSYINGFLQAKTSFSYRNNFVNHLILNLRQKPKIKFKIVMF